MTSGTSGAAGLARRALLLVVALFMHSLSAADAFVQVRLTQAGRDISLEHPEAIVHFSGPKKNGGDSQKCSVGEQQCLLSPGTYSLAVEDPHLLSETQVSVTIEQREPLPILLSLAVVSSATVEMEPASLPIGCFLSAVDEKSGMVYTRSVSRSIPRIRVPARSTILCAFVGEERAIGCFRIAAQPGEMIRLSGTPELSRGHGQAYLGFSYPPDSVPHDVSVTLDYGGKVRAPDALTGLGSRMWAFWSDVPAGRASLRVDSPTWWQPGPIEVEVPDRGTLVRMRLPLARKPSLDIRFAGREALGPGPMDVDLMNCTKAISQFESGLPPPTPRCRSEAKTPSSTSALIHYGPLTPALYAVHWEKPPFSGAKWVDLRAGVPLDIEIPIELVDVAGRVLKKGRPAPSLLRWEAVNEGGVLRCRTDEEGKFSLRLSHPGSWGVTIHTDDGTEWGRDVVAGEQRNFTFDVPANRVRVKVTKQPGEPVAAARVTYEVKSPADERLDFGTRVTNSEGEVLLPALPIGSLSTRAFAKGFRPGVGATLAIVEATGDADILVLLSEGAAIRLRILDADGGSASQATVWSGNVGAQADSEGIATFEEKLGPEAPLVAFDSKGRMGFFRFSGGDEQTVRIPRSGPAIRIRFRTSDGRPVAGQNVIVGMDGVVDNRRLLNQALWSGGEAHSRADGTFLLTGMPDEGMLLIAPWSHPELSTFVALPAREEIVLTVPALVP